MRIDVLTLFPAFIAAAAGVGVVGRAINRGLITVKTWNPRDYAAGSYRRVDDRPFGGGAGMVMIAEPLQSALAAARSAGAVGPLIYLSPQGQKLCQRKVRDLAALPGFALLCGRYEGVDERFLETAVDQELSIGDYVLSGGELGAAVVIDAVGRVIDGVLSDPDSAAEDSFEDGLLDYPQFTRSERLGAHGVPEVLLSGDHARIAVWRKRQALGRTWLRRPDLLAKMRLSDQDRALLDTFIREHLSGVKTF